MYIYAYMTNEDDTAKILRLYASVSVHFINAKQLIPKI